MKLILLGMLAAAGMNFSASGTLAAGSVERGDYLVNTIMGCGNCHTPRGPEGFDATRPLAGEVVEDGTAASVTDYCSGVLRPPRTLKASPCCL